MNWIYAEGAKVVPVALCAATLRSKRREPGRHEAQSCNSCSCLLSIGISPGLTAPEKQKYLAHIERLTEKQGKGSLLQTEAFDVFGARDELAALAAWRRFSCGLLVLKYKCDRADTLVSALRFYAVAPPSHGNCPGDE